MTLTKIMFSAAASIMLASCGLIKDDVEPCSVTQRLSFTYEYNMLYKDLFRSTVSSLHLYAFDSEGILRWQKADAGEHLSEYGYDIDLNECPEGVYTFIVWGGKHDGIPTTSHFKLPDLIPGVSTITDLNCRMHREDYDGTIGMQNKDLSPLYYGKLDNVEIFSAENADRHISQRYKIDLMKDTNLITVVLENEDGTLADINEYRLSTMESNGLMDHNNTLLDDRDILFLPWHKKIETPEPGGPNYKPGMKEMQARMTTGRLVTDRKTWLTVVDKDGRQVVRMPFSEIALMIKDYYMKHMSDQEFLDRQDSYEVRIPINKNGEWAGNTIYINSWKVVIDNIDFE